VNIHCIQNFFTVHDFWETCACPEKSELPWNFSLYWIYFFHSGFLTTCACPENSFPWNFSLYWIYFLPFTIFEQLCASPDKQSCPEIFHSIEYTFYIQDFWATCACPEKQSVPWNFSLYWICFLHSGFLSNLRLPWETEDALNSLLNTHFLWFRSFEKLALALKNRVCREFTVLNMYFLSFRSFEQFALALKNRVCPEFTVLNMYFLLFRIFEQLALGLKNTVALKIFTLLNMYFSSFRIFENLPWKTEFALKFFKPGEAAAPPPDPPLRAPMPDTSIFSGR